MREFQLQKTLRAQPGSTTQVDLTGLKAAGEKSRHLFLIILIKKSVSLVLLHDWFTNFVCFLALAVSKYDYL